MNNINSMYIQFCKSNINNKSLVYYNVPTCTLYLHHFLYNLSSNRYYKSFSVTTCSYNLYYKPYIDYIY